MKVYCACPCACLFSLNPAWMHAAAPGSAPLLSPLLSGRKVLMATATPDSLSICCVWHSSLTVTSPRLTALATAPCYFSSSLQTCTWWMQFFCHELMNDLRCGGCELLHSNQSRLNHGKGRQLNCFYDSIWASIIRRNVLFHTPKIICCKDKKEWGSQ